MKPKQREVYNYDKPNTNWAKGEDVGRAYQPIANRPSPRKPQNDKTKNIKMNRVEQIIEKNQKLISQMNIFNKSSSQSKDLLDNNSNEPQMNHNQRYKSTNNAADIYNNNTKREQRHELEKKKQMKLELDKQIEQNNVIIQQNQNYLREQ